MTTDNLELACSISIPSRGEAVGFAVRILTEIISAYVPRESLPSFELAFNEVLRNAYEHGNLGISADEKAALCESETLEFELKRRQALSGEKKILIEVLGTRSLFICSVQDEGRGFDWRALIERPLEAAREDLRGRGIWLLRQPFDSISYNESGNCITLQKKRTRT